MVTAEFIQDAYEVHDGNNHLLFNDCEHRYLFDYLCIDFSQIKIMLEHFFSKQFDFNLMQLKKDRPALAYNDDGYAKAQKFNPYESKWDYVIDDVHLSGLFVYLEKSHPYFTVGDNALMCAKAILVDYFDSKSYCSEIPLKEDEYVGVLEELLTIPPFPPINLWISPNRPKDFKLDLKNNYRDYYETYRKYADLRHMLKKGRKIKLPPLKIIEEQKQLNKLLLNLLCVSDSSTSKQKNERFSFELNMHLVISIQGNVIREKYKLDNIGQLLHNEVFQMVKMGVKIKICKCCNAYFVTEDMRKNYCNRIIDGDKTCMDVGPNRFFRNQKADDPMYKAYRNAFSKNKMRHTRGNFTDEQFNYWQKEATEKRKNKSNDFYEWLDLTVNEIRAEYDKAKVCNVEK